MALALRSPLERAGDLDGLAAAWLEALPRHAADPRAEVLLRRLAGIRPGLRDPRALVPLLEKALEARYATGAIQQMLIDVLLDLYRLEGREADRARLRRDRGFLTEWLVCGPFGKGRAAPSDEVWPPEEDLRLDATYRDGWQELGWDKVQRAAPESLVSPLSLVYPQNGVAYLLAQVKAERPLEAALQRGAGEDVQIWLNGERVVRDESRREPLENRRATPVRLAAGWNRILIKARAPLWVRLCGPDGYSFPPGTLVEEAGRVLHPLPEGAAPRWDGPVQVGGPAAWRQGLEELEAAASDANRELRADTRLALAYVEQVYGRAERAVLEAERALALLPEDPFVLFHAGHLIGAASYLPAAISKNRSQQAFEEALRRDPGFAPAHERLARFLEADGKPLEAARKARECLALAPVYLPALERLQSIHSRARWEAEEIETVREIERAAPASPAPLRFWAAHYRERGNLEKAASFLRQAVERDRDPASWRELVDLERERGRLDAAIGFCREALQLEPEGAGLRERLVALLLEAEKGDEALALAREMAARAPRHPEPLGRVAEVLWRLGKRDEALAAWREALRLGPGDLELSRFLAAQATAAKPEASSDAFWAPYDERLEDWLQLVPADGPLVARAASIAILDISVIRILADGSHSEYVHQATKLLGEEARDELKDARIPGEPILLRTISKDGETLEPVAGEGRSSYVLPAVERGAVVEVAYRRDEANRHGEELGTGHFYFQDFRMEQSFLLSRYVVLLPAGFPADLLETELETKRPGFVSVRKTVRELQGGGQAVLYEAREAPKVEPEPGMPAPDEYFPNVEIEQKKTLAEVGRELEQAHAGRTLVTPELERAAREATQGASSPLEKARALYAHVNELVPSGGRGQGGRGATAVHVLLEKSGDRNLLYKALLDAAGVPARWAFLRPQEALLEKANWDYPSAGFFPSPHIAVPGPGDDVTYVSLAGRFTPFGKLQESLQGGKALLIDPGRPGQIVQLPPARPEDSAVRFTGTLRLGAGQDVEAAVEQALLQVSAHALKEQFKDAPDAQRDMLLRAAATRLFPGARVKQAAMPGLDDPEKPLAFAFQLTAPKLLKPSGEEHLLKTVFQPAQLVRSFAGKARREHPFHFRRQVVTRDALRIVPGKSFAPSKLPPETALACPLGTYSLRYQEEGEAVTMTRELTLLPGRLAAAEFPAFLSFCERVDAAERESLVFKKKS
jgi:tetratricopeptide (TPR) repeat protein